MSKPGSAPVTRFTKIKFDGAKVRLEYSVTRPGGGDPDEFALQCSDKPLPEFLTAMQALNQDVLDLCEFRRSDASKMRIRGVSLAYREGILGVVITALREVITADAPVIINTPYLPERASSGCVLPAATVRRVRALHVEAERYLAGEREQGSLFTDARSSRPDSSSGDTAASGAL
jgi:hypothetical protein